MIHDPLIPLSCAQTAIFKLAKLNSNRARELCSRTSDCAVRLTPFSFGFASSHLPRSIFSLVPLLFSMTRPCELLLHASLCMEGPLGTKLEDLARRRLFRPRAGKVIQ